MSVKVSTNYFVRVYHDDQFSYDVGPFDSLNGVLSESLSAMDWLYQQIGLLKTHYPNEELIKEHWEYKEKEGLYIDYTANIKVRLGKYTFELFPLKPAEDAKVENELIEKKELPEWVKDE